MGGLGKILNHGWKGCTQINCHAEAQPVPILGKHLQAMEHFARYN
jgi:hypothetical protein